MIRQHSQDLRAQRGPGAPSVSRSRTVLAGLALALAASLPATGPVMANTRDTEADRPVDCPPTMPVADVAEGMVGTGWTVVRGTDPRPFGAEIIGVFPDGIGGGHDLILFRAFDVDGASFIADHGGLWAGMSGSPIYVNGKLIGAVSYGFSASPSTLGGITPIADMLAVSARITDGTGGTATSVSRAARRAVEAAEPGSDASRFRPLLTPAQLARAAVPRLRASAAVKARNVRWLRADPIPGLLRVGGSARVRVAAGGAVVRPHAGENLAAVMSSGLLSSYGVGTTTWVCGERMLAFGHEMTWTGRVGYAMLGARVFDIVDDSTFGSYKLAIPTEVLGRITQDRHTAIAGRLDRLPDPSMVLSTSYEEGERTFAATTAIYPGLDVNGRLNLAVDHGRMTYRNGADHGPAAGIVRFTTTVEGHRLDGTPYKATFADRLWGDPISSRTPFYYGEEVASVAVAYPAVWLVFNPWESVTVEKVTTTLSRVRIARWMVESMEARVNGGTWLTGSVRARKGDRLEVRITLASLAGRTSNPDPTSPRITRLAEVVVTEAMVGDSLWLRGGSSFLDRLMMDPFMEESFDAFLAALDEQQRSDQIGLMIGDDQVATIDTGRIIEGWVEDIRIRPRG